MPTVQGSCSSEELLAAHRWLFSSVTDGSNSKVCKLDVGTVEQNIGRLQVPMSDVLAMQAGKSGRRLKEQRQN